MNHKNQIFESVWDALEDNPVKLKNLKLRARLMMAIQEKIQKEGLKQAEAAETMKITQSRVSALLNGKIEQFRLDMLVNMAHRLGLKVSLDIAA